MHRSRTPEHDRAPGPRGDAANYEGEPRSAASYVRHVPNFANRTLWIGDNLDVLRGIDSGCVDLIYLDPPFNSKRIYNAPLGSKAAGAKFDDTWTMDSVKREWAELMEAADPAVHHTVVGAGLSHSESMQAYLSFMAQRLIEIHRVLAMTGSIYLHCDDTAAAYLKQLMDCILGAHRFGAEIVWKRQSSNNAVKRGYGRNADRILWYRKSAQHTWNPVYHDRSAAEMREYKEDEDGRLYKCDDLTTPGARDGRQFEWRGAKPSPSRSWKTDEAGLEAMLAAGEIELKSGGRAKLRGWKRHLDQAAAGQKCQVLWTDIERVGNTSRERTGWPTQKPLALLRRIIEASSNPGDVVLDPFAGCGTACVAAEQLSRQWAGIDSKVEEVTRDRLSREAGEGTLFAHPVTVSSNPPRRTDPEQPVRTRAAY